MDDKTVKIECLRLSHVPVNDGGSSLMVTNLDKAKQLYDWVSSNDAPVKEEN